MTTAKYARLHVIWQPLTLDRVVLWTALTLALILLGQLLAVHDPVAARIVFATGGAARCPDVPEPAAGR